MGKNACSQHGRYFICSKRQEILCGSSSEIANDSAGLIVLWSSQFARRWSSPAILEVGCRSAVRLELKVLVGWMELMLDGVCFVGMVFSFFRVQHLYVFAYCYPAPYMMYEAKESKVLCLSQVQRCDFFPQIWLEERTATWMILLVTCTLAYS